MLKKSFVIGVLATAVFLLVIVPAGAQQMTEVKCPFRPTNPKSEECFDMFPFCEVFQYRADPNKAEMFEFSCKQCAPGFAPRKPIGGLSKPEYSELPELAIGVTYLPLCDLDVSKGPATLPVLNALMRYKFPNCYKVIVEKDSVTKDEETGDISAQFKCAECDFINTPNSETAFTSGSLYSTGTFGVCQRKMETRECGPICQSEFPGCKKYQSSNLKQLFNEVGEYEEEASFRCLEAEPSHELVYQKVSGSTKSWDQKDVTIRPFLTDLINCDKDWACRLVLPACKTYYIQTNAFSKIFFCKECRSGYEPNPYGVSTTDDIFVSYGRKKFLDVCQLKEFSNLQTDNGWKVEIPGCEQLSVSKVSTTVFANERTATYSCDKCAAGFSKVEDTSNTIVRAGFDEIDNVKIRCRPTEVKEPTTCDQECQKRFPHCLKYTSIFDPDFTSEVETFRCTECESGFEPTQLPDNELWFTGAVRVVCKRSPTPGEVDCNEACKINFPYCDKISITKDEDKHNIYQCHQCQQGYFPIAYEWETRGRLTLQDSPVRNANTIYLCSNNPEEVYTDIRICDPKDPLFYNDLRCVLMQNCKVIVDYTYTYGDPKDSKCIECQEGLALKGTKGDPYSYDLRACQPKSSLIASE